MLCVVFNVLRFVPHSPSRGLFRDLQVAVYDLRSPLGVPPAALTPNEDLIIAHLEPHEAPQYIQYMQNMQGANPNLTSHLSMRPMLQPMMSMLKPATSVLPQLVLPPAMAAVLGSHARGSIAQQSLVAQYKYAQARR